MYSRIIICTITHTRIACKVGRGREGEEGEREGEEGGREREGGREERREGWRDGGRERNTFLYQR